MYIPIVVEQTGRGERAPRRNEPVASRLELGERGREVPLQGIAGPVEARVLREGRAQPCRDAREIAPLEDRDLVAELRCGVDIERATNG